MNKLCLATIKINVVVYKPKDEQVEGFDILLIDDDSFTSELLVKNDHECAKEIKKLLEKTKTNWPKITMDSKA